MKQKIIFLLLLFCSFYSIAQNDPIDKKIQRKYLSLNYLYQNGNLKEALIEAENILNKYQNLTIKPESYYKTITAKALSAYYYADYKKLAEAENLLLQQSSNNQLANLALCEIYLETGQVLNYKKAYEKIDQGNLSQRLVLDLALLEANALYQQGFYNQSLSLIAKNQVLLKKLVTQNQADSSFIYFYKATESIRKYKENYVNAKNIEIQNLLAQGFYKNAADSTQNLITYLKTAKIVSTQTYYNHAKTMEAIGEWDKAQSAYEQAASQSGVSPLAHYKASSMFKQVELALLRNNQIQADHKLRQLQIEAYKLLGQDDPVEFYYNMALIVKLFHEDRIARALGKLNDMHTIVSNLPAIYPAKNEFYDLYTKLKYANSDIEEFIHGLTAKAEIIKTLSGENNPAFKKQKLDNTLASLKFIGFKDTKGNILQDIQHVSSELNQTGMQASRYYNLAAEYYLHKGNLDSAIHFSKLAIQFTSGITPDQIQQTLFVKTNHAYFLALKGNIAEARNLIDQTEKEIFVSSKEYSAKGLQTLLLLNEIYQLTGQHDKSIKVAQVLKSFNRPAKGLLNIPESIETNYALASIYKDAGNFSKASKIASSNISLATKELSEEEAFLFPLIVLHAELTLIQGNFNRAEKAITKAEKTAEQYFGKNTIQYGKVQQLYAQFYESIADYKKGISAAEEAYNIFDKALGTSNCYTVDLLLLRASIRIKSGNATNKDISSLYKLAIENAIKLYSERSDRYNNAIIAYADYLIDKKGYAEAKSLLEKSLEYLKIDNSQSLSYIKLLYTRSKLHYAQKQYALAEKDLVLAISLLRNIFSEKHPLYNQSKGKLARVYYMEEKPAKAIEVMEEIMPNYLTFIEELFPNLSFRQKANYWNNLKEEFDFYNFIVLSQYKNSKPTEIGKVYNNLISTKAILLSSDKKIRESIIASNDSTLLAIYDDWNALKEELGSVYGIAKAQQSELGINISELENKIENLEKILSLKSADFTKNSAGQKVKWNQIKATLKADESVIEITRIRYFNHTFSDSAFYAALILSGNQDYPQYVHIPNANELETRYYKYHRNTLMLNLPDEYAYTKYWSKIAEATSTSNYLYFSPDGIYYQLNPETFSTPSGRYIIEEQRISFLSNSKDLVTGKSENKSKKPQKQDSPSYFLGGNPSYYSTGNSGYVAQLPGAEKEIWAINQLLKNNNLNNTTLTGALLTEDTVKNLSGYKVVHFATHGFFKESNYNNDYASITSPLLNSGLLLYKGGDLLDNQENINSQDGILTAYEAASLNLKNTDLVVLSACETGRGEIVEGEGVYGLQRSFLLAGSNAVIMSLFKVDDDITRKFMFYFYEDYISSMDKRTAFTNAKMRIKKEFPNPLYWGSFLLIEGQVKKEFFN
jgi:CHAT domain-containing protein